MNWVTTGALFFLAAGIFTSVSILSGYQVLFTISVIYFTYLAYKEKNYKLPTSAYWLLVFTAVALLSSFINIELMPKPAKNFGRLKYFLFGVGGIYVFRYWLQSTSNDTKKYILNTLFLSITIAGLYVVYRFLNDVIILKIDTRGRPLTETMRYGYGSAMLLLALLGAIFHQNKLSNVLGKKFAILALIIGFVGMYLTYTRGALLGFLCGIPFVLYFYKPKLGFIFGCFSLFGVLTLAGIYFFGTGKYQSRFLTNKNNQSDIIRRSQWQSAVIAIKERPFLGWGLSNFHSQLKRIKIENDLDAKDYNDAHSHNLFLEIGSGTGMLGLLLFLGWLISWATESFKKGGLAKACIVPFGVAFVVSSQFEVTFDANNASMIFIVYALSAAFQDEKLYSLLKKK